MTFLFVLYIAVSALVSLVLIKQALNVGVAEEGFTPPGADTFPLWAQWTFWIVLVLLGLLWPVILLAALLSRIGRFLK